MAPATTPTARRGSSRARSRCSAHDDRPPPARPLRRGAGGASARRAGGRRRAPAVERARPARRGVGPDEPRLRVNPIACEAHGLCAELLPELIRLDDWGYPILDEPEVPPRTARPRPARGRRVPDARAVARRRLAGPGQRRRGLQNASAEPTLEDRGAECIWGMRSASRPRPAADVTFCMIDPRALQMPHSGAGGRSSSCHQPTSHHAPCLKPIRGYTPTSVNPHASWSPTLASFGSAMPAQRDPVAPARRAALSRLEYSARPAPRRWCRGSTYTLTSVAHRYAARSRCGQPYA